MLGHYQFKTIYWQFGCGLSFGPSCSTIIHCWWCSVRHAGKTERNDGDNQHAPSRVRERKLGQEVGESEFVNRVIYDNWSNRSTVSCLRNVRRLSYHDLRQVSSHKSGEPHRIGEFRDCTTEWCWSSSARQRRTGNSSFFWEWLLRRTTHYADV